MWTARHPPPPAKGTSPCGGRRRCLSWLRAARPADCTRSQSAPSSTVAPSLRSSVAIAAMRSVSLTRHEPMLRSVLGPSAKSAATASVIAASGMWLQSMSMPRRRPISRRRGLDPVVTQRDARTHRFERLAEPDVALDAAAAHAQHPHRSAGDRTEREEVGRAGGVAFDRKVARRPIAAREERGTASPSRVTSTPKRCIRASVMSMYGREISGPATSIRSPCAGATSGAAISRPVRNWLETSPRTETRSELSCARRLDAAAAENRAGLGTQRAHRSRSGHPRGRRSAARACAERRPAHSARPRRQAPRSANGRLCPRCRGRVRPS